MELHTLQPDIIPKCSKDIILCNWNEIIQENNGGAPKEQWKGRAEKRLSKRVFLESPFLLCSLKVFITFHVF